MVITILEQASYMKNLPRRYPSVILGEAKTKFCLTPAAVSLEIGIEEDPLASEVVPQG